MRALLFALLLAVPAAANNAAGPAPDFALPARGGEQLSLGQFRGQVVMINFWATWCGPCRQEMPLLEGIYRKYKPMGFTMIGVNVEPDPKAAEEWLAKQSPVSFPVAFDTDSKVSKLYKVNGMPNSVIIDRKGNVRLLHRGYKPGDENTYLDQIRALVRE
ncbi:MAG: TlpA family protein disulfide reductase [Steroidobacteraceae bacterium]|nr:TlpA family protein disulfide reductase [Steroidobacteraceae bacterium]